MTSTNHVRISVRIPFELYQQLESERYRLSHDARRRLSTRSLLQQAIERFLQEGSR
jgi:hypothetical protein